MRKLITVLAGGLLLAVLAAAPGHAIGPFGPPVEVLAAPCDLSEVLSKRLATADFAVGADGVTSGFVSLGGACGDTIYYVEGTGDAWRAEPSPYHGAVMAVARDATGTYLLHAVSTGGAVVRVRITKRAGGVFTPGRALATTTLPAGAGDVVASGGKWWAGWNEVRRTSPFDERIDLFQSKTIGTPLSRARVTNDMAEDNAPSLLLRSGGNATLVYQRRSASANRLWVGRSGPSGTWTRRPFELTPSSGAVVTGADSALVGATTFIGWQGCRADACRLTVADNGSGHFLARTFLTAGTRGHLAVAPDAVFFGWTAGRLGSGTRTRSFVAQRVGSTWTGTLLASKDAADHHLLGLTVAAGKATVLELGPAGLSALIQTG